MEGKAFGRITRGERCRGQRHAVSISLVAEIRMSSVERAQDTNENGSVAENPCMQRRICLTRDTHEQKTSSKTSSFERLRWIYYTLICLEI